jgi:hypothetical protein
VGLADDAEKALDGIKDVDLAAVGKDIAEYSKPHLKELGKGLVGKFQARYGKYVSAGDMDRFKQLSQDAMDNETKALLADNPDHARQYAQAAASNVRSIETLSLAAEIVQDAQTASLLMEALDSVLEAFKGMAAGVLSIIVGGVIKGAIGSLGGGGGGDLGEALQGGISEFGGLFN